MSLVILFHFLCAQHVSDINIAIIRSLRLFCWSTTLVILFLVRCVLEFRCGWVGVVSVWQAEACNTVLLEKLTSSQLEKKLPAFYGTQRFITAFTSTCQLSLSWASLIKSIPPHPTSWRSILYSSHLCLGLPSGLFPSGVPIKTLHMPLLSPHTSYMPRPSHSSRFNHPNNIGWGVQIIKLLIM